VAWQLSLLDRPPIKPDSWPLTVRRPRLALRLLGVTWRANTLEVLQLFTATGGTIDDVIDFGGLCRATQRKARLAESKVPTQNSRPTLTPRGSIVAAMR
jgi:hypothetical protein